MKKVELDIDTTNVEEIRQEMYDKIMSHKSFVKL